MSHLTLVPPIQTVAAIDQSTAHHSTSDKYRFIKTADVVSLFESRGWMIANYKEAKSVKYRGFQTHTVQLRSSDARLLTVGDSELRVILINDHRGSKSLQIKLGLYRLVCSNGLVVPGSVFETIRIRHTGDNIGLKVHDAITRIAAMADKLRTLHRQLSSVVLSVDLQRQMAAEMIKVRTKKDADTEMVSNALYGRRLADKAEDVWSVFNRIQENMIKGMAGVRAIKSVKRDIEVNEQMFDIALRYAA